MKRLALTSVIVLLAVAMQAAVVETRTIETDLMPVDMDITVVTPEGYDDGIDFPVVYLLNGYDGDHGQWLHTQPRLAELADEYGMVLVMPSGQDSWYWDAPANPKVKMETFITEELVPYIEVNYPVKTGPANRAITGLSMGGHGALWLAMRHPDIFGNAGSTSGAVDLSKFVGKYKTAGLLGDTERESDRWQQYSVISLVPTLEPGALNIIMDCGVDDPFAPVNEALHNALLERKIPHDYISRPGRHSHPYWANSILYHLMYFSEIFDKQ